VSSGGSMAVQFHTAHSAMVKGAGVLAAAPYLCAEGVIGNALGRCMKNGEQIPVALLLKREDQLASERAIDPPADMADDRVWLYRGGEDPYVSATVVDALEATYRARVKPANLTRVEYAGGGHNFPTRDTDEPACSVSKPPYLGNCGLDGARVLLEYLYGKLVDGGRPAESGKLVRFDQTPYAQLAGSVSLATDGWLYVPDACRVGQPVKCRLHVVFHGCQQGASTIGDTFIRHSGYLEVAATNRIVVLFPQVKPTTQPLNPLGCWDWWGYEGDDYATQSGRQIKAVRAMIGALLGDARRAGP